MGSARRAMNADGLTENTTPTPAMDARERDATTRAIVETRTTSSRQKTSTAGALVRALGRWKPMKTPKTTGTLMLYCLGIYVAFYARAPVEITPTMQRRYDDALRRVDEEIGEALRRVSSSYYDAERELRAVTPFGWRFTATLSQRSRIEQAKKRQRDAARALRVEERKRDAAMREARSELGLWSELGVGDAKALFKRSYERGKVFATRSTFWDGLHLMLRGKSDESTISFLLRWAFIAVSNFTMGMLSAIFSYAFALPGLISSFSTSIWSGVAFFLVALVSAVSVVASVLALLYGGAAGGTFALVKYAGPALARLDEAEDRRRARIGQRAAYGNYAHQNARQRYHVD